MTGAASADAANVAERPEQKPAETAVGATSSSTKISYYAQYCFHLSPTLNQWCPMRVADVANLDEYAEFHGQDVYFHMNHPIKWVRVAGVVVAMSSNDYLTIYTVDDGSGATIECVYKKQRWPPSAATPPPLPSTIAPGTVVNVKGALQMYRGVLQALIVKLAVLRSTEQEMQFWAKVHSFAQTTLYRPWVLDRETVRACRKAAKAAQQARDEEEVRKEMEQEKKARAKEQKRRGDDMDGETEDAADRDMPDNESSDGIHASST